MALDKTLLAAALETAFTTGKADPNWTLAQAAGAMADAIDAYVRTAEVAGVTSDVADLTNKPIGKGAQTGAVKLK